MVFVVTGELTDDFVASNLILNSDIQNINKDSTILVMFSVKIHINNA